MILDMSAGASIAVPEAIDLPAAATFEDWLSIGQQLANEDRALRWRIGDWFRLGQERFPEQLQLALPMLPADPKWLRDTARVAEAFPPALRAIEVPFEVHAYVASLPPERRLPTLKRAADEHWGAKQARAVVTAHRQESAMFEDEDSEARLATEIFRAWNRATPQARRYAWPLFERAMLADFAAINEDEPSEEDDA